MEQIEGDGKNDARYPAGANDGGAEGFGICAGCSASKHACDHLFVCLASQRSLFVCL
jgi:hypothetical protein